MPIKNKIQGVPKKEAKMIPGHVIKGQETVP